MSQLKDVPFRISFYGVDFLFEGLLSCYIVQPAPGIMYTAETESPIDIYVKLLLTYLNSKSALQRMVAGLVIVEWARLDTLTQECPEALRTCLHQCLCECVYFDEIALSFTRLLQEARDFVAMLKHYKLPLDYETYGKVLKVSALPKCLKENSGLELVLKNKGIVGGGEVSFVCMSCSLIVLWKIICKLIVSGRC
jgi:hypothetical protein